MIERLQENNRHATTCIVRQLVVMGGLLKPTYKTADVHDSQYFKHTLSSKKWMNQMRNDQKVIVMLRHVL